MQSERVSPLIDGSFARLFCKNVITVGCRAKDMNTKVVFAPEKKQYNCSLGISTGDGNWSIGSDNGITKVQFEPKLGEDLKVAINAVTAGTTIFGCHLKQKTFLLGTNCEFSGILKDGRTELEYNFTKNIGNNLFAFGYRKDIYANYIRNFGNAICSIGFNGNSAKAVVDFHKNAFKGSFVLDSKDFKFQNFKSTISYATPVTFLSANFDFKDDAIVIGADKKFKNFVFSLTMFYQQKKEKITITNDQNQEEKIDAVRINKLTTALLSFAPHKDVTGILGCQFQDHNFTPMIGAKVTLPGRANIVGAVEYRREKLNYTLLVELNTVKP